MQKRFYRKKKRIESTRIGIDGIIWRERRQGVSIKLRIEEGADNKFRWREESGWMDEL